jgi:6,7-dimethyl-8-ribityllumazine synthase
MPTLKNPDQFKCTIVVAQWNSHITGPLLQGALGTLKAAGVSPQQIKVMEVPGTVELTYGANFAIQNDCPDAVIVLGCVIRGDTPHFDYVCQSVTQGVTILNTLDKAPVIFGVLTVNNEQQALDRAGGSLGNKGAEAAATAIAMANLRR